MFFRLVLANSLLALCVGASPLGAQMPSAMDRADSMAATGRLLPDLAGSAVAQRNGVSADEAAEDSPWGESDLEEPHSAEPPRERMPEGSHWGPLACRMVVRQAVVRPHEHAAVLTCVALNADGTLAAAGGDDHHVRLWSTADGQLRAVLRGHEDWVRACAFEPEGRGLITCGDDRAIFRWELGQEGVARSVGRQAAPVYALAMLPERGLVAAAGFEPKVWLHPLLGDGAASPKAAPCADMRALAVSPDGSMLVAAGRCGTVRIWRTDTWEVLWDLKEGSGRIRSLAFSPVGDLLAAGGDGEQIHIWETRGGSLVQTLAARPGKVLALVFCDGETLAAGGSGNDIRLWNLATGELVQRLEGHTGSVAGLAWHAGSGLLVSASFDTTLRFWQREGARPQVARTPAAAGR